MYSHTGLLFMLQVKFAAGVDFEEIHVTLAHSPSLIFGLYPFIEGKSSGNTT